MAGLSLKMYGTNKDAYESRDPEVLLAGPAGSGKTAALLAKCWTVCDRYPGARVLVVRKTRESLTETVLVTFERDILGPDSRVLTRNPILRRDRQSYHHHNGSVVVLGGLDKPDKTLSSEYDLVYVPEATDLTLVDWETLGRSLRAGVVPYQQIVADCNPTTPHHWLYQRCQPPGSGRCRLLRSRHEDNPRYFDQETKDWTPEGRAYIHGRLERMTGARRKRFLEGVWAAAEGLVYAFADAHRLPADWRPPTHWARVWGIDWGQRAPSVLQVWAVDPDGGLYLFREVFKTHCRADHLGKWARGWLDLGTEPVPLAVVCDHNPEEKAVFERETGLVLTMADKTDRDEGIQAAQARFDHGAAEDGVPALPPRIRFRDNALDHPPDQFLLDEGRPTSTVAELTGYTWDPKFLRDTPKADNDHGCDAMRYVVAWADANFGGPHGETRYGYDRDAQIYPAYLR